MVTIEPATQSYVETEINKLCGKEQITQIFGEDSQNSTWKFKDIIRTLIHACVENTSIEDVCTSKEMPSADTIHRRLSQLSLDSLDDLTNEWIQDILYSIGKSFN